MFQLVSYRGIQQGWIACGKARPWDEALLLMNKAKRINGDRWSYSIHCSTPELPSFV